MRWPRLKLIGAGVAALAIGWALAPAGVPLYDGVNFPDEPYRYVAPGPGQATKLKPTVGIVTEDVSGGSNPQGFEVTTAENQPQISLYVPANALVPLSGAKTVTLTATPIAPAGQAPADGPITGNVYRITATSGGEAAGLSRGTAGTITLRAPVGFKVLPELVFRPTPAAAWQKVQTSRVGNDIFEGPFESLGDYANVLPVHGKSAAPGAGHTVVVVLAVVLGIAVVALVVVRGTRSISRASPGDDDDADEYDEDGDSGDTESESVGGRGHDGGYDGGEDDTPTK